MREYKFRVWDKISKRMVYSDDYGCLSDFFNENTFDYHTNFKPRDTYVLMQYTGLKDKNGKQIYEGDIVEWFEENGRFHYKGIVENKPGWFLIKDKLACRRILVKLMEAYNIEVIGNKYENPELLEADAND